MKLPDVFIPEKDLENNIKRLLKEELTKQRHTKFGVIHAYNYAEGIAKLKEQGKKLFTLLENIESRIINYEIHGRSVELFKTWLDSVTGIAYKAKSTKFKFIPWSKKLEDIDSTFNKDFIPIDYDTEKGIEFDSKKGRYNKLLTREEAKDHEFWITVMEGDKEKLANYVDIWFDVTEEKKGMAVYLRSDTDCDELRALILNNDYSSCPGVTSNGFTDYARFVYYA